MNSKADRNTDSRGIPSTIIASASIQAATLLQGVMLARALGPEGRGEFAIATFWAVIFGTIGNCGVSAIVTRLAGRQGGSRELRRAATNCALITGLVTQIIYLAYLSHVNSSVSAEVRSAAFWFSFCIPASHLGMNLAAIDHGVGDAMRHNMSRAAVYPIFLFGLLISLACDALTPAVAVYLLLASNFLVVIGRIVVPTKRPDTPSDCVPCVGVFTQAWPFAIGSALGILQGNADRAVILALLELKDVGVYFAALSAAGGVAFLANALGIVEFSASARQQPGHGSRALCTTMRRATVGSVGLGALGATTMPWLLPFVFGDSFSPAVTAALILLPGFIVSGCNEILGQALRGHGVPIAVAMSKLSSTLTTVIACIVLVPQWGTCGAGAGFVLGQLVELMALICVASRYYLDWHFAHLIPRRDDVEFITARVAKFAQRLRRLT